MPTQTNRGGISLRQLLPEGQILGAADVRIRSCCDDSRQCRDGDLFAAIIGSRQDGHHFATQAVGQGAAAILAERPLPVSVPVCVVPDTRTAFARVCHALMGNPSQQMNVVGVTGTHGKTSTAILLAAILRHAGGVVGTMNSLECSDSFESAAAEANSPAAPRLAQWLARMQVAGCTHAVLEWDSQALARRNTSGTHLDAAVITNLRRAHLDLHGNVSNYHRCKQRILDHLKPGGFVVVNADDPSSQKLLAGRRPTITVAQHGVGEISATVIERHLSEQTFLLSAGDDTIAVQTRIIGDQHVTHCLLATATALVSGIDLFTAAAGLESVDCIPGRMERIECGQPFGVFVDSADSPDRLGVALKTINKITTGRLICVYGADGETAREQRPLLGRAAERGAALGVISNTNPRSESPLAIAHDIIDGYQRPAKAHVLPDRRQAIHWALQQAKPGDSVLVAGRGNQTYQTIGNRQLPCDDRELAKSWLYESAEQDLELIT